MNLTGSGNVTHTEEWAYIFGGYNLEWYPESDQLVQERLVRIWTNFAKYQQVFTLTFFNFHQ